MPILHENRTKRHSRNWAILNVSSVLSFILAEALLQAYLRRKQITTKKWQFKFQYFYLQQPALAFRLHTKLHIFGHWLP